MMQQGAAIVWDQALLDYDMGDHPLDPVRVELTMALARELGVLDRPGVRMLTPSPATETDLTRVHRPDYLDAVRRAPGDPFFTGWGLNTADNPVFQGMHEAAARVCGASIAAAEAVWHGSATRAVNVAGGLHHAMAARASGFCVYNDPAVAIAWLLDQGARRVAYVDVDVHHGDGVQAAFYDDPRVLTVEPARDAAGPLPGHRLRRRDRRPGRRGHRGEPCAAAGHGRRRLAAGLPRGRPVGAARLRALRSSLASAAPTRTASTRSPTYD